MALLLMPIAALLTGVALLLLGSGLLNTLLALRGSLEGFSDLTLGLMVSGYFVGFFLGTFAAPDLIRRVGHIRAFAFCAAVCTCATLLHGLAVNPLAWVLLRVVTGTALVGLYTVIESWLNTQAPPGRRSQVFAIYMVVNLGALALGQQFLRFDDPAGLGLFALIAMLVSAAILPLAWTAVSPPPIQPAPRLRLKRLYAQAPTAVAAALLSGVAMGPFWGMTPLFAARLGLDAADIALLMTCGILGGACLQWPLGRLSDRHDRRWMLAGVCGGAGLLGVLLAFASGPWLYAVFALYGGLAFAVYPVAVAHLMDHLESDAVLQGSSSALLLHGIGAAVGPLLAGLLMQRFGPDALPLFFALVQLMLAGYIGVRLRRHSWHATLPGQFVPMLRTSTAVLELLPNTAVESDAPDAGSHTDASSRHSSPTSPGEPEAPADAADARPEK